jgi:hypothetical protein
LRSVEKVSKTCGKQRFAMLNVWVVRQGITKVIVFEQRLECDEERHQGITWEKSIPGVCQRTLKKQHQS